MPGISDPSGSPPNWGEVDGFAYCLGCRRVMAGEARVDALMGGDDPDRMRMAAEGRVEFELGRDPHRCDTRIARTCGTNIFVVRQVRERLGAYPTRPV